jgi:NAD(P)-dependent dehydrogenase (short-subunit alcohol dehydrogenase family)
LTFITFVLLVMAPNFDLKDHVVAITGGSGGIGYATAQLLLAQGAKVSIADLSEAALKNAVATLEGEKHLGQLYSQVVDVRKPDQVNDWIKRTVEKFGKLDGACNLAGVIPKGINVDRVEDMPDDEWNFVVDVNLHGGEFGLGMSKICC